jgi:hypothetical protein
MLRVGARMQRLTMSPHDTIIRDGEPATPFKSGQDPNAAFAALRAAVAQED